MRTHRNENLVTNIVQFFWRRHETLYKCSMVPEDHYQKLTPKIRDQWWPPYWFPIWCKHDHSFAHISCSIARRTKMQVSIPMFSTISRNILAMSEFTSGAAIYDFNMAAICFTLFCISLPIALWKENKEDSLYLRKNWLCGNRHHMAEFKMAATLLDMQFSMIDICRLPCQLSLRKWLYLHFVHMAAISNFTMTAAFPVLLSVIPIRHICKVGCIPGLPCNYCNSPCKT